MPKSRKLTLIKYSVNIVGRGAFLYNYFRHMHEMSENQNI